MSCGHAKAASIVQTFHKLDYLNIFTDKAKIGIFCSANSGYKWYKLFCFHGNNRSPIHQRQSHVCIQGSFKASELPNVHVFALWEGKIPEESMETPHGKAQIRFV